MTPRFVFPMLFSGMVVGMSFPTNAGPLKLIDEASAKSSLILAQTPGMERRQDRRAARQDCRQQNGLVGQDKRNCKQNARQQRQ